MSLQVCHCGWSKVTTYQGLRTHQGKMGCTPRGVKVEEHEQQYMWDLCVGFTDYPKNFSLDVYKNDYYSDMSLQVCHYCGWSKVTTYKGLKIHQGKMKCMEKRIPEREQYERKNQWEEVDQRKYKPAKTTTAKKESAASWLPLPPSTNIHINSAATAATVKEEYKPYFPPSHSLQRNTNSKSHRQLRDLSTGVEVNRSVRERPTYPVMAVRPKEKDRRDKTLSQIADSRLMAGNWRISSRTDSATTAATIKEEPESPPAIARRSSLRAAQSTSGRQPHDLSTGVQVNRSSRECPTAPPVATVVKPKKKDRKDQSLSQAMQQEVNFQLQQKIQLREEKMREITAMERACEGKMIPEREQYERKNQWEEVDQRKYKPAKTTTAKKESAASLLPLPPSTNIHINSAATAATVKEEPESPPAIARRSSLRAAQSTSGRQPHDLSTGVQVNRSIRERPAIPPRVTIVQPKEKDMKDQTLSQVKSLIRENPTAIHPAAVIQPKEKHREDQISSQTALVSPGINSAMAASKEEPASSFTIPQRPFQNATNSTASHQLQDFSTAAQVNRSSRECPTTPPVATVVKPKKKDRKDQSLSQAMQQEVNFQLQQRFQLREPAVERACETVPDAADTNTQTNSAAAETTTKEDPKSMCETAQPDFSTGMKVKELARMLAATTTQETAVRPKVKHLVQKLSAPTAQQTAVQPKETDREVQRLPQNVPHSTSASAQMNPASEEAKTVEEPKSSACETAELSDFSSGLKVKELARMFSAITAEETAVRPKEKRTEQQKLSQVTLIAQKLSATTAQETAVQPREKDGEDQPLTQNVPHSTSASAQMNPASAEAKTVEEPKSSACETAELSDFSSGLKVKELARMFSAITAEETAVRPKEKRTEQQKLSQNLNGFPSLQWM